MIYLDNNATTPIAPPVREAMRPFLDEDFANPSSPYGPARRVSVALADAREAVAACVGAAAKDLFFTSGGSESINTAFHMALQLRPARRKIVVTAVEHAATLRCAERWGAAGYTVEVLPVNCEGKLDLDRYRAALDADTALVSVMAANNETGILFPVAQLAAWAREQDVYFHCDAIQVVGKMALPLSATDCTFMSVSGHKFHAPKGVGALTVHPSLPPTLSPLVAGGDQELGRRAGTENIPGIVGMGQAALDVAEGVRTMERTVKALREKLETALLGLDHDLLILGRESDRLPNTTLCCFAGIPSDILLARLDMEQIYCSSGSACASGAAEVSPVLRAMQIPSEYAIGAVRVSLSRYTEPAEIDAFVEALTAILADVRV